jgi:hypothetical protein
MASYPILFIIPLMSIYPFYTIVSAAFYFVYSETDDASYLCTRACSTPYLLYSLFCSYECVGSAIYLISYRLSLVPYRLSRTSYRLFLVPYRLSRTSYRLSLASYRLSRTSYRLSLSLTSYCLSKMGCCLGIMY